MGDENERYRNANREMWNAWAKHHLDSALYDVAAFKRGQTSLMHVELEEMGDVDGKQILHLQCHFGMDTLSWARRGAIATGVDFSPVAIAQAQRLSQEIGVPARFVCADVLDLPVELNNCFDIALTSYGALVWLGDLNAWAQGIARCLIPGGTFYMVEFHPFFDMLDDRREQIAYPYFGEEEPLQFVATGSYASKDTGTHENYQWIHTLSSVVNALLVAGLSLEYLHEFDHIVHNLYEDLVESEPGRYVLKAHSGRYPLMYSIKARKNTSKPA